MSLFQGSSHPPFQAVTRLPELQPSRPILKRSRTPYCPDPKRRRTSPTGAFARLSLSPSPGSRHSSSSPTTSRHSNPPHNSSSNPNLNPPLDLPTSLQSHPILHPELNPYPPSYHFNNTTSVPQDAFNPPIIPNPNLSPKELRMKSAYSAYEIEPDRIFIESLSDRSQSPTPSIQLEDDPTPTNDEKNTFRLDPRIVRRISDHQRELDDRSTRMILGSHHFISDHPLTTNDQQLVLYRRPIWPVLPSPRSDEQDDPEPQSIDHDRFHEIIDPVPLLLDPPPPQLHSPQIVELEPCPDQDSVSVEFLDPSSGLDHPSSLVHHVADSMMEID